MQIQQAIQNDRGLCAWSSDPRHTGIFDPFLSRRFQAGQWQDDLADLMDEVKALKATPSSEIKRYELTTFHQSYSYEDFIEGLRPSIDDSTSSLIYSIESGVFKRICERAKGDPKNDYALFIDEINRGNIAKIFGELITLVEEDKREGANSACAVTLPYSKQEFSVPQNLYVIGTMNSVDRSIALLDIALRRRFRFKRINPDAALVVSDVDGINVRGIFQELNRRLSALLGEDYKIGHSYLLVGKIKTNSDLRCVWFENILPLIHEYFFDDWEKVALLVPDFLVVDRVSGLEETTFSHSKNTGFRREEDVGEDLFRELMAKTAAFLKAV